MDKQYVMHISKHEMKQILKKKKREKKNLKPKLVFIISYLLLLCIQTNSVILHPLTHITLNIRKK